MKQPKGLQDRGLFAQLSIISGLIVAIGTPMWGAVIWASDQAIDDKYATDKDLAGVQESIGNHVNTIDKAVTANTETVEATAKSVDSLALVVLDLQRKELADEIYLLEQEKREQGANWNQNEEAELRDKQQALADLNTQRSALFNRVMQQQ